MAVVTLSDHTVMNVLSGFADVRFNQKKKNPRKIKPFISLQNVDVGKLRLFHSILFTYNCT